MNLINKKPCFEDLVSIHEKIQHCATMLQALADCSSDVIQRTSDLMIAVDELKETAETVLIEQ